MMEDNKNSFTWNLTPVELYHPDENSYELGDEYLFSNGSASRMCEEMDVQLRGIININNSSLGGDKSLLIRYIYNNKQGYVCFLLIINKGFTLSL
ncbi:hypothetical protein [Abyssogena phaseoliformis symbiont]|uniref:hypothetical protein n=1 Tax=Abyssogena phaseoliformis symbiont TaxID=596095 RepID=UPI0019153DBF|nr:hypothetical protein [Abyssogena phaseoliformis symbiont]